MSFIAATMVRSPSVIPHGIFSGGIFRINADWSVVKRIYPPAACSTIEIMASAVSYGPRQYVAGMFSSPLIIDEEFRANRQGMRAPDTKPSVSVGGGSTPQVLYTRFYDEVTGERSPLSDGLSVSGSESRSWTNLPTEAPGDQVVLEGTATFSSGTVTGSSESNFGDLRPGDRIAVSTALTRWARIRAIASQTSMTIDDTGMTGSSVTLVSKIVGRATHVELWAAVNGSLPRLIMRVRLGTTTVSEAVPQLALGEAEVDSFEAMPVGGINCLYNDRQLVSGVRGFRDHVFLSLVGFPERYSGLSFRTKYGEPVVGLLKFRDYVLVICPDSKYRLQGYTADDYTMIIDDATLGGIGHQGNIATDTIALIPSRKGVYVYNGASHQGIGDRRTEWALNFDNSPSAYASALAAVNPHDETYQLSPWVPRILEGGDFGDHMFYGDPRVWVGTYSDVGPESTGDVTPPSWTSDTYSTPQNDDGFYGFQTYMKYMTPAGGTVGRFYRGDTFGRIFVEDLLGDERAAHDNPFHGESIIVTGHNLMGDPGGTTSEGKRLVRAWSYVVSEFSAWRMNVWAGDEWAYPPNPIPFNVRGPFAASDIFNVIQDVAPGYFDLVPAGLKEDGPIDGFNIRWQRKSVRAHQMEGGKLAGRGFTFEYRFPQPGGVQFYGLGGVWEPGEAGYPSWLYTTGE